MTAAATTGPNRHPRPTSSTPATSFAPESHARFSNFCVHFSRLSKRIFSADAESFFATGRSAGPDRACDLAGKDSAQKKLGAIVASVNENGPGAIRDCAEADVEIEEN